MKYLLFILVLLLNFGCNKEAQRTGHNQSSDNIVNVDSLNAVFLAGWNNKDSAAIMATLAPNAVVMNDSLIHTGKASIAKNWISLGVRVLSKIKASSSIKGSGGNLAYDAGTYTLDLTIPGGPVLKERGNYSLLWTQKLDGQWLLTLVHIEDVTRLPDIDVRK